MKRWTVEASFHCGREHVWEVDGKVREAAKLEADGSGMDLDTGRRDIVWYVGTLPAAERLAGRLLRAMRAELEGYYEVSIRG